MKKMHLKLVMIVVLLGFVYSVKAQEEPNIFMVVDNKTHKPIAAASIVIIRAKLAISTEKDGIFIIPGDLSKMRDTVIISAQGYVSQFTLLHKMVGVDSIKLAINSEPNLEMVFKGKESKVLNEFNRRRIVHYAGLHTETAMFDYLELAQQFYLPKPYALLKQVKINRLAFNSNPSTGVEMTKFRIKVYGTGIANSGPGKELCSQLIEIKDRDNQRITVGLEKYNIIIPGQSFFVAIEWIRDFTNQGFDMVYQDKIMNYKPIVNFRPAIGISPIKGDKLNIWGLNMKRQWKPYTYFSPDYTDLAIIATVAQ